MGIKSLSRKKQRTINKQLAKFKGLDVATINGRKVDLIDASEGVIGPQNYTLKNQNFYWSDTYKNIEKAQSFIQILPAAVHDLKANFENMMQLARPRTVVLEYADGKLTMNYDYSGVGVYSLVKVDESGADFKVVDNQVKEADREMCYSAAAKLLLALHELPDCTGLSFNGSEAKENRFGIENITQGYLTEDQLAALNDHLLDGFFNHHVTAAEIVELGEALCREYKSLSEELKTIRDVVFDRLFWRTEVSDPGTDEMVETYTQKFEWREGEDIVKRAPKTDDALAPIMTEDEVLYTEVMETLGVFMQRFQTNSQVLIMEATMLLDRSRQIKAQDTATQTVEQ